MTILVGYGTGPHSQRAMERAAEEARLREVPLHIVAVFQHDSADSLSRVKSEVEASESLEAELRRIADRLGAEGLRCTTEVVHGLRGEVARDLLDVAKAIRAELLVLGLRRRSPVGKLVMGSVSQEVILGARCPVLAVKADDET